MSFDLIRVCLFGRTDPDWLARIRLPDMRSTGADDVEAVDVPNHLRAWTSAGPMGSAAAKTPRPMFATTTNC